MAQAAGESRQRVLDAALRLFGARGYGGTPLQAIAEELGLSKASVYYYFPAKGDLLEALAGPCLERLAAVITDPPDTAAPANSRALLHAYLALVSDWRQVVALLIGDPTVGTLPAAIRFRADRERLRQLLALAGSPPAGPLRATCCLGAVERAALDFPPTDTTAHRSTILDAAMRALGAAPIGA
jgi:AcrR family transcriptional regulator